MIPLLLAAALSASPIGELHVYGDWIVGCDNTGACHATTLDVESTSEEAEPIADNALGMAIKRSGWAHDPLRFRFLACYQCETTDAYDETKVGKLSVLNADGKVIFGMHPSGAGADGWPIPSNSPLVQALSVGKVVNVDDTGGRPLASISLRGLNEALRQMDREQYRVGNVTALVERGAKAAYLLPPRTPMPSILLPPPSNRSPTRVADVEFQRLQREVACKSEGPISPEAIYQRLDDHNSLLLINTSCGSYNTSSFAFIVDESGRADYAQVRVTEFEQSMEAPQLVSAYWDDNDQRLRSFARGRALADCGQQQAFAWDGKQFLLVEEADMGACRGSIDYITVYRRQTRPDDRITIGR